MMQQASSAGLAAHWAALIACEQALGCIALKDGEPVALDDGGGASVAITAMDGAQGPEAAEPVDASDASDPGLTPLSINSAHLSLWLTADRGITCIGGRIKRWEDQSNRGDHARPVYGAGPQCDLPSHAYMGVNLPYFSAPKTPNIYDETLDLDLNCLVNTEYTVFVVERRWADYRDHSASAEYLVSTPVPGAALATMLDAECVLGGFQLGYAYDGDEPHLVLDQGCSRAAQRVDRVSLDAAPALLSEEVGEYNARWGRGLWVPGLPVAHVADTTELMSANGGAIGRGIVQSAKFDTRFRGDIAEIIIYDSALTSEEATNVEKYLALHWHRPW